MMILILQFRRELWNSGLLTCSELMSVCPVAPTLSSRELLGRWRWALSRSQLIKCFEGGAIEFGFSPESNGSNKRTWITEADVGFLSLLEAQKLFPPGSFLTLPWEPVVLYVNDNSLTYQIHLTLSTGRTVISFSGLNIQIECTQHLSLYLIQRSFSINFGHMICSV